MNFWEQFLLMQAQSALHALLLKYGSKAFTTEELNALNIVLQALIDMPQRLHAIK